MGIGAMLGTACFDSQDAALDAYYSHAAPSYTAGATSYLATFEKVSGTWKVKRYQVDSTGSVSFLSESTAPVVTFPHCDTLESFNDGLVLGWGVVAAMVAAACISIIRKGL